jgi:hypothetical protein
MYIYYKHKFLSHLRNFPSYSNSTFNVDNEIKFEYSDPDDESLVKLKEKYDLLSVRGNGSEFNQIINLMQWVHNYAYRTPNPSSPKEMTSLGLLKEIEEKHKNINCRMYATILNDIYLSMGFKSRIIDLLPNTNKPRDIHVVTVVYSNTFQKWIYMDADFGGYFTDDNKNLLSIEEIRQKLTNSEKLIINEKIGPRTRKFSSLAKYLGKKTYKTYISKNIFKFRCPLYSEFAYGAKKEGKIFVDLIPDGFDEESLGKPDITEGNIKILTTKNVELYWQKP